jgi:hypothetical protein
LGQTLIVLSLASGRPEELAALPSPGRRPQRFGRLYKSNAAPVGLPWLWALAYEHYEDRTPTHGYAATREDAMAAFAKSWRRL